MDSLRNASSPTFRNLILKQKQSPVELKEKMRKNYKHKVQTCRSMLFNKFRCIDESNIRNTLTEIYKSMFPAMDEFTLDDEECKILDEIQNELVQEEMEWWLQEYEKSQMEHIDWSTTEQEDNVICFICQKANLILKNTVLLCPYCKLTLNTTKSLLEIKNLVINLLDKHNIACSNEVQFTVVPESSESHIYLICETCMEMQLVV